MQNFSVLISIYSKERPEYFRQCLNSIINQSVPPNEIVIVEDGPLTEELYDVISEYSNRYREIKINKLEKNYGLGKALNFGLGFCTNDLVARMDTDDIAMPNRFEKQLSVFEKYPQVEVVSSWIDEFDSSPQNIISTRKLPQYSYEIYQYAKKRCPINHPAVMFKKKSIQFAGGYLSFPLFEDYYLWIRLLINGAKFYNIQESLLLFRTSPEMYQRRGGLKYIRDEMRFQNLIKKLGFISFGDYIQNLFIRLFVRIVPNSTRRLIYNRFLRE